VVVDELHRLSTGTADAIRKVERVRARVLRITATTLWHSRPARALQRRLPFDGRVCRGGAAQLRGGFEFSPDYLTDAAALRASQRLLERSWVRTSHARCEGGNSVAVLSGLESS
jgi:hypothetical protein